MSGSVTSQQCQYHQNCLAKSCRICGFFKGEKSKNYLYSTTSSEIKDKILLTYEVDVTTDDPKIYPTKLCNNCYLSRGTIDVFKWYEHLEDGCKICQYFECKQRGGRKRKKTGGKGRPPKKQAVEVENAKRSIEIPNEVLPPKVVNSTPEIARFLNPPPDVLCPVCKEVLHMPIQSSCQHFFCQNCIHKWLEHSGENAKCPVCVTPISAFDLQQAPRLLINILRSLLVLCSVCKQPIALEQLDDHQYNCKEYIPERPTTTLPQLLVKPLTEPLDKHEERLATQLIKRKLNLTQNKSHIFMKTGGTPIKLSVTTAAHKNSSEVCTKTRQRRASEVECFRQQSSSTDDDDQISARVQLATELKGLRKDERQLIVKEAGLALDIPPDEGLAMKTELGLPGLHISIGIFERLYELLTAAFRAFDKDMANFQFFL